jgi:hypothetical protein
MQAHNSWWLGWVRGRPLNVRCGGKTGRDLLVVSLTAFDPSATLGAQICCGAQRGFPRTV